MNWRALAAFGFLVMFSSVAVGQNSEVNPDPGIVKPGSPLYGLDTTFDRVTKSKGGIAFERASEVHWALENNQSEEAENARKRLELAASKATNESRVGLVKAESVLMQAQNRTDKDVPGLGTALEQVRAAKDRAPPENGLLGGGEGNSSGGLIPDVGPGRGGAEGRGR